MGGTLTLVASFPDSNPITIAHLGDLSDPDEED